LFYEYRFFKKQSEKLIELQEDYRTYVVAVNKILKDYNRVKEKLEELNSDTCDEKKNDVELIDDLFFNVTFPDGVTVFSSDDSNNCNDTFLAVNRDLDYLKQTSVEFIKCQPEAGALLKNIDCNYWSDYNDYILEKREFPKKKAKKKKKRKKRKISSYPVNNARPRKIVKKRKVQVFSLSWPIDRTRFWISSLYGPRKKRNGAWGFHYGVDMAALTGTPVLAAYTGIVIEARYSRGYGNTIVLAHSRKYRTRYAHLSKILVKVGQKIKRGTLIGKVGDTGYVRSAGGKDASHLHFEVVEFGKKINPMPFIQT